MPALRWPHLLCIYESLNNRESVNLWANLAGIRVFHVLLLVVLVLMGCNFSGSTKTGFLEKAEQNLPTTRVTAVALPETGQTFR